MALPVHFRPLLVAARADHLAALKIDARHPPEAGTRSYDPDKRLKRKERSDEKGERDEEEEEGGDKHRRDSIGLPRLAAAVTRDKLKESMLEYTRKMAQYKNAQGLYLHGSGTAAGQAAAATAFTAAPFDTPAAPASSLSQHPGCRAQEPAGRMPADERKTQRHPAAAIASGQRAAAGAASLTDADSSPPDESRTRRSLAFALSQMLKSAATVIKVDGKGLNRLAPPTSARSPDLQHVRRADQPADREPIAGYAGAAAAVGGGGQPSRPTAAAPSEAGSAPAAAANSPDVRLASTRLSERRGSAAAEAASGDERVFEVVPDERISLKSLLSLPGGGGGGVVGGRRQTRNKRMKIPEPLLSSIVEDDREERDHLGAALTAGGRATVHAAALSLPRLLDVIPEATDSAVDSEMHAAWRRQRRHNVLLRLVNASASSSHEVSKYMTSYARKKLHKLPTIKAVPGGDLSGGRLVARS